MEYCSFIIDDISFAVLLNTDMCNHICNLDEPLHRQNNNKLVLNLMI